MSTNTNRISSFFAQSTQSLSAMADTTKKAVKKATSNNVETDSETIPLSDITGKYSVTLRPIARNISQETKQEKESSLIDISKETLNESDYNNILENLKKQGHVLYIMDETKSNINKCFQLFKKYKIDDPKIQNVLLNNIDDTHFKSLSETFEHILKKFPNKLQQIINADLLSTNMFVANSLFHTNTDATALIHTSEDFEYIFDFILSDQNKVPLECYTKIMNIMPIIMKFKDINIEKLDSSSLDEKRIMYTNIILLLKNNFFNINNEFPPEMKETFPVLFNNNFDTLIQQVEASFMQSGAENKFGSPLKDLIEQLKTDKWQNSTIQDLIKGLIEAKASDSPIKENDIVRSINKFKQDSNFAKLDNSEKRIIILSQILFSINKNKEVNFKNDILYTLAQTDLSDDEKKNILSLCLYLKNRRIYELVEFEDELKKDVFFQASILTGKNMDKEKIQLAIYLNDIENHLTNKLTPIDYNAISENANSPECRPYITGENPYEIDLAKLSKEDKTKQNEVLTMLGMSKDGITQDGISNLRFLVHGAKFQNISHFEDFEKVQNMVLSCSYLYPENLVTFGRGSSLYFAFSSPTILNAGYDDLMTPIHQTKAESIENAYKKEDKQVIQLDHDFKYIYRKDDLYPRELSQTLEKKCIDLEKYCQKILIEKFDEYVGKIANKNDFKTIKNEIMKNMPQGSDLIYLEWPKYEDLESDISYEDFKFYAGYYGNINAQKPNLTEEELEALKTNYISGDYLNNEVKDLDDNITSIQQRDNKIEGGIVSQFNKQKGYNEFVATDSVPSAIIVQVGDDGQPIISQDSLNMAREYAKKHNIPILRIPQYSF